MYIVIVTVCSQLTPSPILFLSSKGCEHVHLDITICQIMLLYIHHNYGASASVAYFQYCKVDLGSFMVLDVFHPSFSRQTPHLSSR
jgi:hypothetical protein